jgi:hypothetical protein
MGSDIVAVDRLVYQQDFKSIKDTAIKIALAGSEGGLM